MQERYADSQRVELSAIKTIEGGSMFIRLGEAKIRKAENMEVANYITRDSSSKFSLAAVTLRGQHAKVRNPVSDRGYFVLEGKASVVVGDQTAEVSAGDVVFIPAGTWHLIEGNIKYISVNSPPFDPALEEVGE